MPVSPTYPGVYIEELSSGVHTIIGVATSITAFLGRTKAGPTNQGITLTTFGDFERTFGELDPEYPVGYAVYDFFTNGGSQAVVVRLFKDLGAEAAANVAKAAEGAADDAAAVTKAVTDAVTLVKPTDSPAAKAAEKVAAAVAGADPKSPAKMKAAAQAAAEAITDTSSARWDSNEHLKLEAAGPGAWGNDLRVTVDKNGITPEVGKRYNLDEKVLFNLNIYRDSTLEVDLTTEHTPDERIENVSLFVGAGERRLDRVLPMRSNLVTASASTFYADIATAKGDDSPIPKADLGKVRLFKDGLDGGFLGPDSYMGSVANKTGIHGLDDVDLFNILCIPPDVRGGQTAPAVYNSALTYCVSRRAVLIVDPPQDWSNRVKLLSDPAKGLDDLSLKGPGTRNAFLYYPRVRMPDPKLGGAVDTFPACGIIAGIFARTDTQRGVWVAPAGLDASLGGATPEVSLTDRENGILNPLAINCLRSFPVVGSVVWGARTLRGADLLTDEYKYLPVRRTALFIEESLYRGTQWVVFQPNDEPLWALVRLNIGAFMNDLFRKGAFQGSKPQDAYFVRCDHTTTTQNDIDRGVVNIVVGFAPLKPAEFVIVQLQQIVGQIQT